MPRNQHRQVFWVLSFVLLTSTVTGADEDAPPSPVHSYQFLRSQFAVPDPARWGEVPLWWWEGDRMAKSRVTWQLETLAEAGVKSVCPIQRSPGRCDPPSFSPEWWDMFTFVHQECTRLGMTLWAYDQVGYGHYGWLEKAAAQAGDKETKRLHFLAADGSAAEPIDLDLPAGQLLSARAFPRGEQGFDDRGSLDISTSVTDSRLRWTPPSGAWRVAVCIATDDVAFQLSPQAGDTFIDMLYGEIERRVGREAMGKTLVGVFQDEHPPTPRDIYTSRLAAAFRQRCGYDITRAIPALHFDVGPATPKYRTDFFDVYLALDQFCYWQRVYQWISARGLLTSHDNWGRQNIDQQSRGYIDYFRTQRWFSAPGYDDAGTEPVSRRNYYDTKIAASIARLYQRPRVWSEAFHSSGWGRTTDQTLSWLSANYVFGANLYDEHGLYYSARASTWEHAAPDPHWRQPYWRYYRQLSDWVARTSFLMSQGTHVVDVAVHYPVVSLLAGDPPSEERPDYNYYMQISRRLFDDSLDNDIIDDDSILRAQIDQGCLIAGNNRYQALVFPPQTTIRPSILKQAIALVESGGTVVFVGRLPTATTERGREDQQLPQHLERLFGRPAAELDPAQGISRRTGAGGLAVFMPGELEQLPGLLSQQIQRDFIAKSPGVFVTHRRIHDVNVYLVQNATEAAAVELDALCRVDGVPEVWDPFTGDVQPIGSFQRRGTYTSVQHLLQGNVAQLIVFRPGDEQTGSPMAGLLQPDGREIPLSDQWEFSVIPTRDNRWGEFRWPPSDQLIGPEIRSFRYAEASVEEGLAAGWQRPSFDDTTWSVARYSIGPYWLCLTELSPQATVPDDILSGTGDIQAGAAATWESDVAAWKNVEFSQTIGLARPAPWGGHSGYPDGAIDQEFIDLPPGRKLLFTRLRVPQPVRLGLRVELRNSSARMWVNGVEQPFEDAVGNLPLNAGENTVLLDLPDGGHGMLYVQRDPPTAGSMAEAARGHVAPDLRSAQWIRGSDPAEGYLRRTIVLEELPREARIVATAYTGYQLFVNGKKIHEEIGPWANWTHPESFNVAPYLRPGKNVIAAWVQAYAGQNVHGEAEMKALACVLRMRMSDGREVEIVSDDSWRAASNETDKWQQLDFDDADWKPAAKLAAMGEEPWGTAPLENQGVVTEPHRSLSIDLPSPYLTCFQQTPEVIYDVKPQGTPRSGWFRFQAPPGLKALTLHTSAPARIWVDGEPVEVHNGIARLSQPPTGHSTVAMQVQMQPGAYAGAAFPLPLSIELQGGTIQPGLWADWGLPTYSGIGVYRQTFACSAEQLDRRTVLDLGQVLVAAEVLMNGRSAGIRLARPFQFDVTSLLKEGANQLEIRVANTIAPDYTVTNHSENLGPTDSGLLGPVTLKQELPLAQWRDWAEEEIQQLQAQLLVSTPQLTAPQKTWESQAKWEELAPASAHDSHSSTATLTGNPQDSEGSRPLEYHTSLTGISGLRLELLPDRQPSADSDRAAALASLPQSLTVTAQREDGQPLRGRFVRIEIPGRTEFLHMAEVQVCSGDQNIAPQGVASQSSTGMEAVASRAIDGVTDGSWGSNSVTHTGHEPDPWWEVDLQSVAPIQRIVIYNRTDGELENRLSDFRVSLLDETRQAVWQERIAEPPNPRLTLDLSPMRVELVQTLVEWTASYPTDDAQESARQVAILQTRRPAGYPQGTLFRLAFPANRPGDRTFQERLRFSVTASDPPLTDIPPSLARIIATPESQRTAEQTAALAAFYRSIAPELEPVRQRLLQLQKQLAR